MSEIVVPLTADQYAEIVQAEQAKAEIEQRKSMAVRFLLLAHATRDRVDAALAAGALELRELEAGAHALVLPDTDRADTES